MKEYVVGFMFNDSAESVVLIVKNKPEWQRGHLNGVGGKVERNETPDAAIVREFIEEAGVEHKGWKKFCVLSGPKRFKLDEFGWNDLPEFKIHFYCAFNDEAHDQASTIEDERIIKVPVVELNLWKKISNLNWLIPMALTYHNQNVNHYEIQEIA